MSNQCFEQSAALSKLLSTYGSDFAGSYQKCSNHYIYCPHLSKATPLNNIKGWRQDISAIVWVSHPVPR